MRRADRLFQIVQMLRRRRLTTAAQLAERLEVSERTIYRDVQDLGASGIPIEGEAGVGYRLGKDFELPPLMFNVSEIQALVLGARMVEAFGDDDLRTAARAVLTKVEAVLPAKERHRLDDTALFSLSFKVTDAERRQLGRVRRSIDERKKLRLDYQDQSGAASARVIRPLALYFWGGTWTVGAWCELRQDHRNFRIDRIAALEILDESFELTSPVTVKDYVRAMTERA